MPALRLTNVEELVFNFWRLTQILEVDLGAMRSSTDRQFRLPKLIRLKRETERANACNSKERLPAHAWVKWARFHGISRPLPFPVPWCTISEAGEALRPIPAIRLR